MTKYVARYNGQIVGKRTTQNRLYTHAVVVQDSEAEARALAYGYTATEQDRSNYRYYELTAAAQPGDRVNHGGANKYQGDIILTPKADDVAKAKEVTKDGFDGYVSRQRQHKINGFEEQLKKGGFNPYVATWCGRPDLAQKEASRRGNVLAIVPAEQV